MSFDYAANGAIRSKEVRLINETGEQVGVISTQEALNRAKQAGLDLVAISPNSNPPVCKILDFGKFKFDQSKREKEAAKAQREARIEVKEIQLRPVTDQHDLLTKARKAQGFLKDGNKIKLVLKFRGREIHHADMGRKVMESFLEAIGDHKLERPITMNERQLFAIIVPLPPKKD